jgi:hypothetical protein
MLIMLTASPTMGYACSWAIGYFHQVTYLRGTIVGVNQGDLRHMSRWLRQRVARPGANLTLYEYWWPAKLSKLRVIRQVKTDQDGHFDFGALPDGHYALAIETPGIGIDEFDVEIVRLRRRTASVTIDISPVHPDCKGGHEFIAASE